MPGLKEITLETPSSSGESEKPTEPCQRKKKKNTKHGSASSQIPRAYSAQRVENKNTQLSCIFKTPSKSLVPYRLRKSLSQMDMKQSKNMNGRYQKNYFQDNYKTVALPKPVVVKNMINDRIMYPSKDNFYYMVDEPKCGEVYAKVAGMKIFSTIMLNSWRKRRDDVRRLNEELDQLQKKFIKVKNQVHVLSSVFRNEQKQNEKLSRQLRHASEDIEKMRSSIESVTTSLISAKADASLYEQQYRAKEQENECLNNILAETNSQLFKSMGQVRHLQTNLSCEQRSVQQLENHKKELLNEITLAETKWKRVEEQHLIDIYHKNEELAKANSEIKILETLLMDLKDKEFQVRDLRKLDLKHRNKIELLQSDVRALQADLNKCLSARIKSFLKACAELNHNVLLCIHLGAFYLLPAIPQPKVLMMPFTVDLKKVMSVIR